MKKHVKLLFLLVLMGLLLFLFSFSSARNGAKKVTKMEVEFKAGDNGFLTHEAVNKLLIQNNKSVKNLPKRGLDLHSLEGKVLSNPYVENAAVYLTLDGALKTVIKQREPIARIVTNTTSYYIDKEGIKIPLSSNFSARVPLIRGVQTVEGIEEITQLVNIILADNFFKKEIVGIKKDNKNEYIFNVRSGRYKIDFGTMNNEVTKFKKLKAFYNKAFADKTITNYQRINVKYHNQVVCTK